MLGYESYRLLRSSRDLLVMEYRRTFGVKESRKRFINISLLTVMIAEYS